MPNTTPPKIDDLADILSGSGNRAPLGVNPASPTPWGSADATAENSEEKLASGVTRPQAQSHFLAKELTSREIHPVLIFGTRAAGKSTLLTSLFSYLNLNAQSPGTLSLDEPLVPVNNVYGEEIDKEVKRFFNFSVLQFVDGSPAERTELKFPIFIPLKFSSRANSKNVKVALLESPGEFYAVNAANSDYFPTMKNEIQEVYEFFPNSISVLIIAPYNLTSRFEENEGVDLISQEKRQLNETDRALYAALQLYQQHRTHAFRKWDRFLFVLTKWDEHIGSVSSKEFSNPPPGVIESLINDRFPMSWPQFQLLSQVGGKNVMPYSAGVMTSEIRLPTPERHRAAMAVFPHKLWNWIYNNALGNDVGTEPHKKRTGIFHFVGKVLKKLFM